MIRVLILRLLRIIPVFLLVTVGVFGLAALLPGDPAIALAGDNATPEQIEEIRVSLGLDQPWIVQYASWLGGVLTGDLGTSLYSTEPVLVSILNRMPVTLSIALVSIVIAILIGLFGGVLAAVYRGRAVDRVTTIFSTFGIATPTFWVAMILVIVFAFTLGWLPAVGYRPPTDGVGVWLSHIILPSLALGMAGGAELLRHTRSSMAETLSQDYIRTARAQGLRPAAIVWRRALRNASVPIITVLGFLVAQVLAGAVITEQIFSLPGLGTLAIDAVFRKDLPVIQGVVLVNAAIVLVINLTTDFVYTIVNPKVRHA